ncbi:MAG TPA: hypothetical protein V6D03_15090 [Candidatus Caenarcaniphilales bacterium]
MAFFRQTIAPFLVVLVFLIALLAVSARIFLPSDMAKPAPVEEVAQITQEGPVVNATSTVARLSPNLMVLINGLPDDPAVSEQL